MDTTLTERDFDEVSWHDCHIWGIAFGVEDPDSHDWTSTLTLDIDYILDWVKREDEALSFRIAPASLVFRDVTDPSIHINWQDTGFFASVHHACIDSIQRTELPRGHRNSNMPYYKWKIAINWPEGGEIAFGAAGFYQELTGSPLLVDRQHLTREERNG